MSILHAIILGIVQGLTEFLPVSSSGHLNVFPWLLGWEQMPESFDVALHIGTLLAILIFFFKDWIALIVGGYKKVVKKEDSTEGKIFWYLVAATIPAGILSLVLDKVSEKIVGDNLNVQMAWIAGALIVMGIILYIVDKKAKSETKYENISLKQSVLVGLSQAIAAAFPGTSRSGITMTVARMLKIDRESAAKFSFLLAAPITAAAVLVDLKYFTFNLAFILGVLASFIVGMFVIKFLLNYLKKGSFKVFAIYRILFGLVIIGFLIFK
jgi:undecaprenyl-diphosphatase